MKIFKDLRVILAIVLIISWIGAGLGFFVVNKKNTAKLLDKDAQINNLNTQLSNIDVMVPVAVLATDVIMGKEVEEADITFIEVPEKNAETLIKDFAELTPVEDENGQRTKYYYKSDLHTGTVLSKDNVYDEVITSDLRYYDVVTHQNPIGLEPGTYIDIRIQLPLGEDYVGLSHKKVIQLNSGVLKLILNEEEIHVYNSMLIDSMLYPGAQIYAVQYIEGGIQDSAIAFYPISTTVLSVAEKDPNLLQAIQQEMQIKRQMLETKMDAAGLGLSEKDLESLNKIISTGRNNVASVLSTSQKQVDKEKTEYAKQQAKDAAAQQKAAAAAAK